MHRLLSLTLLGLFFNSALGWGYSIYTPQGHREALMGNNGIAYNASEGAAIYNPAGAAGLESSRISAGGSLLNASVFELGGNPSGSMTDKTTSPSYTQIPGLITGYQKFDWGRTGFFINTDYNITFDKFFTFNSNVGTSYTELATNLNALNLGLLYANSVPLGEELKLQFGFTVSLGLLEMQQSTFSKAYLPSTSAYISGFANQNVKTTNIMGRVGTLLAAPSYSVGAYYQPRSSALSSSFSNFSYQVSSVGEVVDNSTNEGPPLLNSEIYGAGVGFALGKSLKVFVDANVVTPDDSTTITSSGRVESAGSGLEYTLKSDNHIYGGVTYSEEKGRSQTKGWMTSTGFDYKVSFIKNYFGIYYTRYTTPEKTEGSNSSSGSTLSWLGILIASQYSF